MLFVRGRITSADGAPLAGAILDIWQTGPDGGYDYACTNPAPRRPHHLDGP